MRDRGSFLLPWQNGQKGEPLCQSAAPATLRAENVTHIHAAAAQDPRRRLVRLCYRQELKKDCFRIVFRINVLPDTLRISLLPGMMLLDKQLILRIRLALAGI